MPEQRQVAVFRNNFLPYSETFIHDELRYHVRYRPTVFARTWRNEDRFPGHVVVCLEKIPGMKKNIEKFVYQNFRKSWTFDAIFKKNKFDIIHGHFGHNAIYALPYAKKNGIPLVVSLHGHDVTILAGEEKQEFKWGLYRKHREELFDRTAIFLAASTDLRDLIISCGCPSEKVVVHRLGIDLSKFNKSNDRLRKNHVVMIGRFVEKKGFEYGIRAFLSILKRGVDATMTIVGNGELYDDYKSIIDVEGIAEKIVFTGALPHDRIIEILNSATVLLAPSVVAKNLDRDSGLIVAKEAAACGVPVIGSIHGGIPDIVEDRITGFLVNERDVDGLAEKLRTLLSNSDLRMRLGRNARLKMEREYDIRICNERLEAIYDSMLKP